MRRLPGFLLAAALGCAAFPACSDGNLRGIGRRCAANVPPWDTVQVYNPKVDQWYLEDTTMPTTTSRAIAATVDEWIYVLLRQPGDPRVIPFQRYRPSTGEWQEVPLVALDPSLVLDLVATRREIHAISDDGTGQTRLDSLETTTLAWTPGPSTPGIHFHGVQLAGDIYALGANGTEVVLHDPVAGAWVGVAPLPAGFTLRGVEADGLYIWAFDAAASETVRYDFIADAWSAGPSIPSEYQFGDTAISGNRIYLLRTAPRQGHSVMSFDPVGRRWRKGSTVRRHREGSAAAAWDGRIYTFGGTTSNGCMR